MATYSDEYQDVNNLSSSRSIPSLNKNIYQFIDQVEVVIQKTKVEISKLIKIRDEIIQKYFDANNKLNMMIEVQKNTCKIQTIKNENIEQLSIDDLSSLKSRRNKYE
jgi:flagellar biosynthesis chaperone FliJ